MIVTGIGIAVTFTVTGDDAFALTCTEVVEEIVPVRRPLDESESPGTGAFEVKVIAALEGGKRLATT